MKRHRSFIRTLAFGILPLLPSTGTAPAGIVPPATWELEFTYEAVVRNIPAKSKRLQVWAPVPHDDAQQTISDVQIAVSLPYRHTVDAEYGNAAIYIEASSDLPDSLPLRIIFRVRRRAASPTVDAKTGSGEYRRRFLDPDALVPIDGRIAAEAMKVVDGLSDDGAKARAIYEHIVRTMRYDKTGAGWGRGDAIFACTERRGNCTDIHSLLIGMARAAGIPARFVIGFPIPADSRGGSVGGYHCWADLYVEGQGWVPVDASEAIKHPDRADYYFGTLDADRVAFTIGRDIRLDGGPDAPTANYFIYPYVLVDGREYLEVTHRFAFRTLNDGDDAPASGPMPHGRVSGEEKSDSR